MDRLMDYTGYLLRTAFLRAADVAAREFGSDGHPRDAAVLATLQAVGPLSQQQLAKALNVNRTVMVKLIDGLETRGYVERVRNPEDRRAYLLHPTRAGLESMTELLPRMARAETALTANLSAAEHARLNELLRGLIAPPPPALADRTAFLLTRAHHRYHDRADAVLSPLELQIRYFGVLVRLADGTVLTARARRPPAGEHAGRGRARGRARGARARGAPARHGRPAPERRARHARGT